MAEPERRPLVGEQVSPAAGARRLAALVHAVRDRAGARDHDDADPLGCAGDQRHVGVVDDMDRASSKTEAGKHTVNELLVVGAIDAGDAETDGRDRRGGLEPCEDLVERFLDAELAFGDEVGAAGSCLAHDGARLVGEQSHGLGAAGVDADHVSLSTHELSTLTCRRRMAVSYS